MRERQSQHNLLQYDNQDPSALMGVLVLICTPAIAVSYPQVFLPIATQVLVGSLHMQVVRFRVLQYKVPTLGKEWI